MLLIFPFVMFVVHNSRGLSIEPYETLLVIIASRNCERPRIRVMALTKFYSHFLYGQRFSHFFWKLGAVSVVVCKSLYGREYQFWEVSLITGISVIVSLISWFYLFYMCISAIWTKPGNIGQECLTLVLRIALKIKDTQFHINSLNDDTLLHIFGHFDSLSKCQLLKR